MKKNAGLQLRVQQGCTTMPAAVHALAARGCPQQCMHSCTKSAGARAQVEDLFTFLAMHPSTISVEQQPTRT